MLMHFLLRYILFREHASTGPPQVSRDPPIALPWPSRWPGLPETASQRNGPQMQKTYENRSRITYSGLCFPAPYQQTPVRQPAVYVVITGQAASPRMSSSCLKEELFTADALKARRTYLRLWMLTRNHEISCVLERPSLRRWPPFFAHQGVRRLRL